MSMTSESVAVATGASLFRSRDAALARQAALTKTIKAYHSEWKSLFSRARRIKATVYAAAHEWCQISVATKASTGTMDAVKRLADTIRVSPSTVSNWYYCGEVLADFALDAAAVDPSSVRQIASYRGSLAKHELARCVQIVREGGNVGKVLSIISRSAGAADMKARNKAAALVKAGALDRRRLRMEMLALKTLAQKFYGPDAEIAIHIVKDTSVEEAV